MFGGAVIALVLHKLYGLTYSMTAHGTDFLVKNQLLAEKIAHAAFVRVGTQFNADYLRAMIGETAAAKLFVLPFGIDVSLQPKPPSRPSNHPPKIVNIGRLVWQKGQLLLIDAAAKLRDAGYDFSLDIIGEGEMRGELEQAIVAKGLGAVVKLCGALPRGEAMGYLANADIFVFSSVSEGFGIVLLEAMLSGTAIIAPRLNGIPEIIEHDRSGKLFDVGNVEDMAAHIKGLLIDPSQRQKLTENAVRVVREQFDHREKIVVLLKIFQENYN
jgi:glycosyltransferase involved in cell wall biosynthesis